MVGWQKCPKLSIGCWNNQGAQIQQQRNFGSSLLEILEDDEQIREILEEDSEIEDQEHEEEEDMEEDPDYEQWKQLSILYFSFTNKKENKNGNNSRCSSFISNVLV